jgi:hypothetical protein
MSELETLLKELRTMKLTKTKVANTAETWSKIGQKDWQGAGFNSEEEMVQFISDNPYLNM